MSVEGRARGSACRSRRPDGPAHLATTVGGIPLRACSPRRSGSRRWSSGRRRRAARSWPCSDVGVGVARALAGPDGRRDHARRSACSRAPRTSRASMGSSVSTWGAREASARTGSSRSSSSTSRRRSNGCWRHRVRRPRGRRRPDDVCVYTPSPLLEVYVGRRRVDVDGSDFGGPRSPGSVGLAIAEALAAEGANVAMFARRAGRARAEAERIGGLAVQGDVRDPRGAPGARRPDARGLRRNRRPRQQQRRPTARFRAD